MCHEVWCENIEFFDGYCSFLVRLMLLVQTCITFSYVSRCEMSYHSFDLVAMRQALGSVSMLWYESCLLAVI